jgi:hypothetical protein
VVDRNIEVETGPVSVVPAGLSAPMVEIFQALLFLFSGNKASAEGSLEIRTFDSLINKNQ